MALDDAELVRRFQQGDSAAFEALVRRYQRDLFTFLVRFAGNREIAEDLFQETFVKVLQALPAYREQGRFGPWLFGIANRVAVDAWRRERARRRRVVQDPMAVDLAADPSLLPDRAVEQAQLVRQVERVLASLPEKQRRVFLLRQHGALSFKEIAGVTGEPLNTVLSHMHYAIARLRRLLEPAAESLGSSERKGV